MIVTLDAKRRLRIPAALAPVRPGDRFSTVFDAEEDTITFRRFKRKGNWLDVWSKCPVPMEDHPTRSRELPTKRKL